MNRDEFSEIMEKYKKIYDTSPNAFCVFEVKDRVKHVDLAITLYGLQTYIKNYHIFQQNYGDILKVDDFIVWCQGRDMKCFASAEYQNIFTIAEVKRINNKFKKADILMPEYQYLFWEFVHTYNEYIDGLSSDEMEKYAYSIGRYLDENGT